MSNLSPPIPGEDCGACCREMSSPPSDQAAELPKLPAEVGADYESGMRNRHADGWPDGVPCFWLADGRCKYYDHRPEICRDFKVGGEGCLKWRMAISLGGPEV